MSEVSAFKYEPDTGSEPDGVTAGWLYVWSPGDVDGDTVHPHASMPIAAVTIDGVTHYVPREDS